MKEVWVVYAREERDTYLFLRQFGYQSLIDVEHIDVEDVDTERGG